jgi:hypothetical protein
MTEDRLAEIKRRLVRYDAREGPDFCECCRAMPDVAWLVAELERLRAVECNADDLEGYCEGHRAEIDRLRAENARLAKDARLGAKVRDLPKGAMLEHVYDPIAPGDWPSAWYYGHGMIRLSGDTPDEALGLEAQP